MIHQICDLPKYELVKLMIHQMTFLTKVYRLSTDFFYQKSIIHRMTFLPYHSTYSSWAILLLTKPNLIQPP